MTNYIELSVNQKINYKTSFSNKLTAIGNKSYPAILRIYQDRFESIDRIYDYVRTKKYFQTGGLRN